MEGFRTLIKGWLGKLLLVVFLAGFALVGIEGYFMGSQDDVAIKVNDLKITQTELDSWIKSQKNQYLNAVAGDETLLNQKVIEQSVYEAAIVRSLLLQRAEKLGFKLSDEQLGALLSQQQAFQQDGKFSQQALDNYLMANKMSVSQLLNDFSQQTSLTLFTQSILATALHSKADTQKLIDLVAQERSVQLAEIPLAKFAENFTASDQQVQSYYEKNKDQYKRLANVDVSYVILNKDKFLNAVQLTEQEIEQQYQTYVATLNNQAKREISHILITTDNRTAEQALKLAQQIEEKLKQGTSFESLVSQYSDDPDSKARKGKVDGYTVGAYGDSFDKAVLSLEKGQLSAPIKTNFGYHIIRLDSVSGAAVPTLTQVREQMVQQAKQKKAENEFQDAIGNANDLALQSDSLDAVAQQYQLNVQTQKNVQQNTSIAALADPSVKTKLFSTEVAQGDQNVSTGISLKNNDVLWFKVAEYRAERPLSLAEAKPQILQQLKRDEQIKQANASVAKLLDNLKNKTATEALVDSQLHFQNLGPVPRYSQMLPEELEKAIYSVRTPKAGHWSATTVASGGFLFVAAVTSVGKNPAFQLNEQQQAQVVDRFDARSQLELNDYIEYLRSIAKIKKTEK